MVALFIQMGQKHILIVNITIGKIKALRLTTK